MAHALQEGLEGEGYEVVVERTGEGAFFRLNTEPFDVILLDLVLPGRDGLQILTTLRERGVNTPVLVLTARDTLEDRVDGLDAAPTTIWSSRSPSRSCWRACARCCAADAGPSKRVRARLGDLEMDLVTRQVTRGGSAVELTVREFELLEYLLRHEGQVVSREALARDVWKETVAHRRRSTTSSTSTSRGCAGRSTSIGR